MSNVVPILYRQKEADVARRMAWNDVAGWLFIEPTSTAYYTAIDSVGQAQICLVCLGSYSIINRK
jgi:hypothetical protein